MNWPPGGLCRACIRILCPGDWRGPYVGHGLLEELSEGKKYRIPPNHYFVMGDNTFNSSDSRYWGDFDRTKVIGKSCFVYWPIGKTMFKGEERISRFGWSHR